MRNPYDVLITSGNRIIADVGADAKNAKNAVINMLQDEEIKEKLENVDYLEITVNFAKEHSKN